MKGTIFATVIFSMVAIQAFADIDDSRCQNYKNCEKAACDAGAAQFNKDYGGNPSSELKPVKIITSNKEYEIEIDDGEDSPNGPITYDVKTEKSGKTCKVTDVSAK